MTNCAKNGRRTARGPPRAFVDAVIHLIDDPGARRKLAAAAQRAGATLDWDEPGHDYEQILERYLRP